jgi:hypothetical protein
MVPRENLVLIPSKKDFAPGILPEDSEGEILIQAPFFPAEGLFNISSSGGIVYSTR